MRTRYQAQAPANPNENTEDRAIVFNSQHDLSLARSAGLGATMQPRPNGEARHTQAANEPPRTQSSEGQFGFLDQDLYKAGRSRT